MVSSWMSELCGPLDIKKRGGFGWTDTYLSKNVQRDPTTAASQLLKQTSKGLRS